MRDAFFGGRCGRDAVDVDARQVHVVRIDGADLDDLFDLDDSDPASHRAGRVEVAVGLAEQQVAGLVGLPGLYQRDVGNQCGLQSVVPSVDLAPLLSLCDHGSFAGGGDETPTPRTPR